MHVFAGNDNIRDAWWPYGNGDMLQRAMLVGYRSGFYTDSDLLVALDMATGAGAKVIGKTGYGLEAGHEATFLAVDAPNRAAAVAGAPTGRAIVKRGEFRKSSSDAPHRHPRYVFSFQSRYRSGIGPAFFPAPAV